jgi:polysaccharide chain length determinant protein (PEP-CTERM system associated)
MMQVPKFDIYPYWEFVKRRKWWVLIPFLAVVIAGSLYLYQAPRIYKASTVILVEDQRVPESYVKSTITEGLESRLHTITQQVKSRSYLEKVITRYDLFLKRNPQKQNGLLKKLGEILQKLPFISEGTASTSEENDQSSLYSKVQTLRERIRVSLQGKENNAFEIGFQWHDPDVAAKVANAIASQFIEQNLKIREEMAMGTTSFLTMQVQQLREQLEKKERELENFREKNMGKLPKQLESNLNILNQLKDELNNLEKRVDMEKQQAMMLRSQIRSSGSAPSSGEEPESGEMGKIAALKNRLDQLQSKYTSKHPDVIALKRQLKNALQAESGPESKKETEGSIDSDVKRYVDASTQGLKRQLAQTRARIDNYERQIKEIREKIDKYQTRVEATPKVEMQLRDLQRDYKTVDQRYHEMLSKKLNAQMSEELEKRQKGEQFRVIDSAVPPSAPFKPDVRKLGFLIIVLGLGFGGGLAYVRESLDPAFYSQEDVEKVLGRRILVTLPWEESKE